MSAVRCAKCGGSRFQEYGATDYTQRIKLSATPAGPVIDTYTGDSISVIEADRAAGVECVECLTRIVLAGESPDRLSMAFRVKFDTDQRELIARIVDHANGATATERLASDAECRQYVENLLDGYLDAEQLAETAERVSLDSDTSA